MTPGLDIVILGLSVSSSWGNGHATTYRGLVRALAGRGHRVQFLERDVPWYAANRDLPEPEHCRLHLYGSLDELAALHAERVRQADLVILGSFVPEGVAVGRWMLATAQGMTAFYDIDTPVTLSKLEAGDAEYLSAEILPDFDLYLSFTGGPTLRRLETRFGARRARALYCSVDPERYRPRDVEPAIDLGYLGTYSDDRQPTLEALLLEPARAWPEGRFAVAGPQYPDDIVWPPNVARTPHLAPDDHPAFYGRQRFTLNVTRAAMIAAGWSPSVRLFEAAACGTPIVSDWWPGLDEIFRPDREIRIARSPRDVLHLLQSLPEAERLSLGRAARRRVLAAHTAAHRAVELEGYVEEVARARRHAARPALDAAELRRPVP